MGWRPSILLFAAALLGAACSPKAAATTSPEGAPVVGHGEVAWASWDKKTFEQAQADNRIILINVVAEWCHWCHVMEEETYADPEVAALLRDHFMPIKVDSDARPDVAERYRQWGWPATAMLSPDARPVLELRGFQKPEDFKSLLKELIAERDAGRLKRRKPAAPELKPSDAGLAKILAQVTKQLDEYYDERLGGWGMRQKYPFPEPVEHALARATIYDDPKWVARVTKTLEGERKIIDPVWGGIFQYSVGGTWDEPHYEKITAIQAGAIHNFARAARVTSDERWLGPARQITSYMDEFMRSDAGGYYTSQDADLRREGQASIVGKDYYAKPDAQRRKLGLPRIDKAVYADLNGMMVLALVELYEATLDKTVLDAALTTTRHIMDTHRTEAGAFKHGADDDVAGLLYLRDQAAMGRALLALYRATGDRRWRDEAKRVGEFVLAKLEDPEGGGFYAHTEDPEAVGVFAQRRKPVEENGVAARFLVLLHRYLDGDGTDKTPYFEAATRGLRALSNPKALRREGRIVGGYLLALEEAQMPIVDITVVGDMADGGKTKALFDAALQYPEPRGILELSAPGERYPKIGKPAVYFCTETACSSPIKKPDRLRGLADGFLKGSLPAKTR